MKVYPVSSNDGVQYIFSSMELAEEWAACKYGTAEEYDVLDALPKTQKVYYRNTIWQDYHNTSLQDFEQHDEFYTEQLAEVIKWNEYIFIAGVDKSCVEALCTAITKGIK